MLTLSRPSRVKDCAHRIFLSPPTMLLETRVAEQRNEAVRKKTPRTVEELSLCLVELVTLSRRFWYAHWSFSEALVETFGEQVRPLIGPTVRRCIELKVLDVWIYASDGDSIRSETNPQFFLDLTDLALVERLDSDLSLLSPTFSMPSAKELVIAFVMLGIFLTIVTLKVLQPWGTLVVGILLFGFPLGKLLISACVSRETRVRIGLFLIDYLDLLRFVVVGIPLLSVRWIFRRLFRHESRSYE